jgi:hypothetical protein
MAKNSITDYSKTAASNTDIQSVDIAEGCLPSGINNAIREIMADLADMNDGTVTLTSPSFAAATITGDLTVDTNTLYVDSTNNRVGIGTSLPLSKLNVKGTQGNWRVDPDSVSGEIQVLSTTPANDGFRTFRLRSNESIFETGGSERMRIDSSGNIGIGTSSPNANLGFSIGSDIKISQVAGTAHQSGNAGSIGLTISDGGNHSGVFVNNSHDGTYSDQFITFNTAEGGVSASTERMRIDSSGNVGIGDTAPVTPLTIATTNKLGSTFTGTTNGEGLTVTQTNYTAGNYISLVEAAYDDSNDANPNVRIGAMFDGNGSNLAFGTSNGYGSGITNTAMFINSSGRVGIGTSSPSAPLHVVGNSYVQSGTFYTDAITAFSGSSININAGSSHLSATVNGSERMRIDSSGNVLVGKTSDNFGTAGCEARPEGSLRITRDNSTAGFFNRLNSDGTIVNFYKDSSSVGSIGTATSEAGKFRIAGTDSGLQFRTTDIVPTNGAGNLSDNTKDMGDASARFDDIFATNGTIQTSDQNEKQDIEALSEAEQRVAVAAKGLLRKFRWIDSVEEKGDDARIHFGIIAQDLQAAFEAEGLDAGRYAMFINSTWTDEETGEERSRMGVRYNQLLAFIIAAI